MGMIVTLHLISVNVYNSVNAPANRGFSYIEVWMFGAHCPIFMALFEYGLVLYLKKIASPNDSGSKEKLDEKIKKFDFIMMAVSFVFFVLFSSIYWIIVLITFD